jgi:hypothetical protein
VWGCFIKVEKGGSLVQFFERSDNRATFEYYFEQKTSEVVLNKNTSFIGT